MGSQNSMHMIEHPLPKDYRCSLDNPTIYISIIDQRKLEKHIVNISNKQDLHYEQEMFIFRKCHSDHIIAAKYFQNLSYVEYCAKSYQVCYYTQYPEKRFSEIKNLTYQQGLLYLIDALKGFNILSQKVGWFRVNARMIALDCDHKIKVWLSDNFSETRLRKQRMLRSEKQFVLKIISVFDSKMTNYESTFLKMIQKNTANIENINLQLALNLLIKLAEVTLEQKKLTNSLKDSEENSNQYCNLLKNNINQDKAKKSINNNKNNKQKSLKRTRKTSQQSIADDKKVLQISNAENTTNYMSHNVSYNQSFSKFNIIPHNPIIYSDKKDTNDFTFHAANQSNRLQPQQRFNLFNGQTLREDKTYLSHDKHVIIQKKKARKSMDQYQLNKVSINNQIIHQPRNDLKDANSNYRTVYNNYIHIGTTHQNYIPPLNLMKKQQNKKETYEICETKSYTRNTKQFNGQNLQSLNEQQTHKIIMIEQPESYKDRTSLQINLNSNLEPKSNHFPSNPVNNETDIVFKSNLMSSNGAILGEVNTIKSIIYSQNGAQQKPQSVIIKSIHAPNQQNNILQRTPTFNKYSK